MLVDYGCRLLGVARRGCRLKPQSPANRCNPCRGKTKYPEGLRRGYDKQSFHDVKLQTCTRCPSCRIGVPLCIITDSFEIQHLTRLFTKSESSSVEPTIDLKA